MDDKTVRLLSRTLLYCAQVLEQLRDPYGYRMLQDAVEYCVRAAISRHDILPEACSELQRCLEEVGRLHPQALRTFLLAERHVLLLLLHIRTTVPDAVSEKPDMPTVAEGAVPEEKKEKHVAGNGYVSESAQQVFLGIQQRGPVRAKDIIAHCSPMSERTIRRSLRELVHAGLVVKDTRHGGIRYRVAHER